MKKQIFHKNITTSNYCSKNVACSSWQNNNKGKPFLMSSDNIILVGNDAIEYECNLLEGTRISESIPVVRPMYDFYQALYDVGQYILSYN